MTADERINALLERAGCPVMVVKSDAPPTPERHMADLIDRLEVALENALNKPMQKPLTLTQANSYQDPMWIEFKVFQEASGWRDGLCDALNWAHRVYRDLNREAEFMVHYRLWRHRPTDEERSAAAWEI